MPSASGELMDQVDQNLLRIRRAALERSNSDIRKPASESSSVVGGTIDIQPWSPRSIPPDDSNIVWPKDRSRESTETPEEALPEDVRSAFRRVLAWLFPHRR
jgi:hypothetical protein